MSVIQEWNRAFFKPTYSIFEFMSFLIISELCSQFGWICFLLIIPVIFVNGYMNHLFKEEDDRATMAGE